MDHEKFIEVAKKEILYNEKNRRDLDNNIIDSLSIKDVFIVWSCKTLQNSKALLSMKHKGAYYYEVTMDGSSGVIYIDSYTKVNQKRLQLKSK